MKLAFRRRQSNIHCMPLCSHSVKHQQRTCIVAALPISAKVGLHSCQGDSVVSRPSVCLSLSLSRVLKFWPTQNRNTVETSKVGYVRYLVRPVPGITLAFVTVWRLYIANTTETSIKLFGSELLAGFKNKKDVLSRRWPRDARYISWAVAEIWPFEIIQDGGGRHLEFIRIENSAIRSAVSENPTL